jgi:hypothetical protein
MKSRATYPGQSCNLFNLIHRVQTQWHICNNGMHIAI